MKTWKTLAILVALMLAVFAGCSDMIESLSQIELKVTINDHNIPLDSVFTLYGTHEGSRDQVTKVLGSVTDSTLLPLQSGTWNLRVEARENGIVKGEGSCTVSVSPGTTMPATINMIYQYAVTFNADGGSSLSIPGKDVVFAAPYGSLATATKTGYTLEGWYTAQNGSGMKVDQDTIVTIVSPQILHANWVANTYAVTFDKQSGTNGSDTVSATYDATMPSATAPMRTGYTFGGYYDQANGAGTQYYTAGMGSSRSWDKTEATTLFAKWTAISYALTYVLEDGTNNSANPGSYTVETATITLQEPTKTGYTFGKWFSDSAFTIGNEVTEIPLGSTQDKTLYAKWTANSYAVTFDRQSGTDGSSSVNATYDATMPSAVAPTKTGYTFGGYYDQANGAGTQYYTAGMGSSRSWDKTEATTLFAKWTAISYALTYVLEDGTNNSANPGSYTIETATITLQAPTKTGYTFDGWFSNSGFTGSQVTAIALGSTGDRTLYAKWTPISYTVTFDKQSGTDGFVSVNATYDAEMPNATAPTRTGYTFGGYYDQTDGGGTQYYTAAMASTQSWDKTDITPTLYAKWIANTSVVTLDMQSGTGGSGSVNATYDAAMPNAIVPEKTGYLFGGYYDQTNGGGTQYYTPAMTSARTWNKTDETTTLYAKWSARLYPVVLDMQSGTGGSGSVNATYDAAMPGATAPTRTGYTFGGYYDQTNGGGTQYYTATMTSARSWNKTDNAPILYAKWTPISYTLTYVLGDGTNNAANPGSYTIETATITLQAPSKTGYTFGGWFSNSGFTGSQVTAIALGSTGDRTLYAKWTPISYALTYVMEEGTNNSANPGSYTIETATITLQAPTKTGYTFDGWFSHSGFTGSQVTAIALGSTGDRTLYAKWTPISYTVTFDKQSGSDGSDTVSATYDATMPLATPPMRTGYTFGGYYDQTDGGGTQYYTAAMESTRSWDKTDIAPTLFAKWIANTSVVTLDMQSGANGSASVSATYDAAMPNAIVPEKTGYLFGGYYDQTNGGGTQYYTPAMTSARTWNKTDENTTLYAKWSAWVYPVVLDMQSGTGGSGSVNATYDTAMPGATAPTRTGYTFGGYYDQTDGGGTQYYTATMTSARTWNKADNAPILYAKWTIDTYPVRYDANSASSGSVPAAQTKTYGSNLTLASNTGSLAKTGYTFAGWNTAANGSGTDYAAGATYSTNAALTLYAKWTATIIYDSQSATVDSSPTSQTVTWTSGRDTVGTLPTAPQKTGYTFDGWYTAASGAGTSFNASSEVTGSLTLYAKWTATMTYDSQSATVDSSPTSQTVTWTSGRDTVGTLPTAPQKTGYTFGGWYTAASGAGTAFDAGSEVTGSLTLYAKWIIDTYPVRYDANSASSGSVPAAQTKTYGTDLALASNIGLLAKTGYTFAGWNTAANGSGTDYATGAAYSTNAALTLYAKWNIDTYPVSYDANSASSGSVPSAQTKTYGSNLTLASNTGSLAKTGYTFAGWNTAANGSGTDYAAGATYSTNAALTLYAKWIANTSVVTLDMQSGANGSASVSATYDAAMPNAIVPEKTVYLFGGYYDQTNGGGTQYYTPAMTSARTWNKTDETTTLYAKWSARLYSVLLDMQSGTGGSGSVNATYDAAMPGATAPTRTGYTFGGYYDQTNGGGTQYYTATMTSARSWNKTDNAPILYAKWTIDTYPVRYDANSASSGSVPAAQTKTYGSNLTLASNTGLLAKTGYTFAGWNTAANGSGTDYAAGATYSTNAALTLYAKWIATWVVGGLGPSGGYIFHDKGSYSDGWRYLEAAPSDIAVGAALFGYYRETSTGANLGTGATGTAIGTGKTNTANLVSKMGETAYISSSSTTTSADYAANLATKHIVEYGGVEYKGWFLPSRDELYAMFVNLVKDRAFPLGNFLYGTYNEYWSSSEDISYDPSGYAIAQTFSAVSTPGLPSSNAGDQYYYSRRISIRVRPVRAF